MPSKPIEVSEDGVVVSIPHNLDTWFVKTIERQTARGNEFGFISGADGKVMWNDDGTIFNKKWAEAVVVEHNDWLLCSKPLALKIVEAQREVNKRFGIMNEAENLIAGARSLYRESVHLLAKYEKEVDSTDDTQPEEIKHE